MQLRYRKGWSHHQPVLPDTYTSDSRSLHQRFQKSRLNKLLERRYDAVSTVFCTQYAKKDWHQRLGGDAHADAIMDRIVHRTIWVETGDANMREQTARR